jgi:hypothetical protein
MKNKNFQEKNKMETQNKTEEQIREESKIRNEVFASYLKQVKGEKLSENDKANIEAWKMCGKYSQAKKEERYIKLKHTWNKAMPYPIEVVLNIDKKENTYWIEVNGCQETSSMTIPNTGIEEERTKEVKK